MDALDRALALLSPFGPEYGPHHFSNHAPMVAEALCALGREDAVMPWVERYAARLSPAPGPTVAIDPEHWREALGNASRFADWRALFDAELACEGHPAVLARWIPRFSPGVAAAALHALLRVAHATRALDHVVTPARLQELAQGLAYWGASYQELGGELDVVSARAPSVAIGRVARVDLGPPVGSITGRLAQLAARGVAQDVLALAAPGDDPFAFVADLARTMAAVYAANVAAGTSVDIAFVHGVTGSSALRLVLPHLTAAAAAPLLRRAWQVCAGLHAAYGQVDGIAPAAAPLVDLSAAVTRAVDCGDEHAIKWIEACDREQRATGHGLGAIATLAVNRLAGPG